MSARLTNIVFAFGTSRPDSTIIVDTSTSTSPFTNACMQSSSSLLAHLPVGDGDPRARHDALDVIGDRLDGLDAIVDEKDLSAAIELARNALVDQPVVPRLDVGEHGRAIARRRLHQRHVAQAGERQMQRARNRRRREREHVGLQLELLEPFLVLDAEPMLLVDDDQSEIRELDVGTQQPMRTDDDVDLLFLELGENRGCSFAVLKSTHRRDADREIGQPFGERAEMLVGEDRRRHEHGNLPSDLHRLERRAHGDFSLAVADVADEQAIHRPRALHVALHLRRRGALVGRVLEEKRRLELPLPRRVGNVRRTVGDFPPRVEIEQLDRHLLDRRARSSRCCGPAPAAELVQARRRRILGDVVARPIALELIDAVQRNVEPIAALVLDDRHLDRALSDEDRLDAAIDPDAVLEMHDEIARLERDGVERRRAADVPARAANTSLTTEDLVIRENAQTAPSRRARARNDEPAVEHADRQRRRRRTA